MRVPWQTVEREALESLRSLIRLDTTNPPGNERLAANFMADQLGACGIESVIREGAPTRSNLVARIPGRDSNLAPLLLSSHTDVVPVEPAGWSRAPFGAEIADGCVWGRGSIDMKSKCAMDIAMLTALKRAGVRPERDLIVAAVADEEGGSELGAKFMVERYPELVRAGYVLNEIGGFTAHLGDRRIYPIQVAEKGFITLKMTVTGLPGHASVPRGDTAIARLAKIISKISSTPMRQRITPLMKRALSEIGVPLDSPGPLFHPMIANTVVPTMMQAGYKDNVIPGEAWAVLDGRTLPGDNPETFMAELRSIVGDDVNLELIKCAPPAETTPDGPMFELIRTRLEAADPGARAIPWMIPGATDNKYYSRLGAACYGFTPLKLDQCMPFGSLFHGHDERLPLAGFYWGLRVYADVVLSYLGLKPADVFA
jgi:acetylornithine deacetylase/succinyl-diaminopimelate desuccinylase-like protein